MSSNQQSLLFTSSRPLRINRNSSTNPHKQKQNCKAINQPTITHQKNNKRMVFRNISNLNDKGTDQTPQQSREYIIQPYDLKETIFKETFPRLETVGRVQVYHMIHQFDQLEKRQKWLREQSRRFICKMSLIIALVLLLYLILLKSFLFFTNMAVITVLQGFKQQFFDPKVSNEQLQLQVLFISQGCFVLTTILVFLFIFTTTLMVNKYYMKQIREYRANHQEMRKIKSQLQHLGKQIKKQGQIAQVIQT